MDGGVGGGGGWVGGSIKLTFLHEEHFIMNEL